jgi:thioredoxin reductase (NADPH)
MQELIIIGSGPAGITASLYAARAGIKTLVISQNVGSLIKAGEIGNYYGFTIPIPGQKLLLDGIEQARNVGVEILEDQVINISNEGNFTVSTKGGQYKASSVVLATGANRAAPKIRDFFEYEGKGISYCAMCDAFFYRGKDVAVLGCCDYALHEAKEILPLAKSVTLMTNGVEPIAQWPTEIRVIKTPIAALEGKDALERVRFADGSALEVVGVFIAIGVAGSSDLAKSMGAVTEGLRIVVDEHMATNIPGLYSAGDCTGGMMQVVKASHEGAIAGTQAVSYIRRTKQQEKDAVAEAQ